MDMKIHGAKSGGDQHKPVEAPDNLRSKQVARYVDVISEGEIIGLKDGLKSVFMNETPIMNKDGSFNFKDVSLYQRLGTVNQDAVPDMSTTEFEVAVGAEVKHDTPLVRSITQANVKAVRVTLGFPQLTEQNMENGDLNGSSVSISIQVQTNGGGYVDAANDIITGKTTSRYQRAYMIQLAGDGPWDIRVVRTSPDSTSSAISNKTFWDTMTGIIPTALAYPNSALVAMRIDAANFSSIPNRAFLIRGLVVRVPSNYDPDARTYSGLWDGTFKLAWTNNPAWCFYDLLTNPRYGLGQWVKPELVDKWNLYSIAKYCDTLVPNGKGGMEPRFTCNLYLQARADAYQVIQNMASIFRAITFWANGTIFSVQDRPSDAVAQFNQANVVDGVFTYAGTSLKARHTVALVSWNDPDDFYRQKVEYVQDDDLVNQYGIIESPITAFGCSSQAQAHRLGKWMLATERFTDETISFRTGFDGLVVYPGAVFQVTDPNRAGQRMGGRILAHDSQYVVLDSVLPLNSGHAYRITVTAADGTLQTKGVMSWELNDDGTSTVLRLSESLTAVTVENAVYIMTDLNTLVPELWRVTTMSDDGSGIATISGTKYVPDIYDNVETGIIIDPRPTTTINTKPATPTNLAATVSMYRVDGQPAGLRVLLSWTSNAGRFRVSWRRQGTSWKSLEVYEATHELENVDAASYDFMVVAISTTGRESNAATLSVDVGTKVGDVPSSMSAPQNLRLLSPYIRSDAIFGWDKVPEATGYEVELSKAADQFVAFRTEKIGDVLKFIYSPDDMKADGGPFRSLTIRVRALGSYDSHGDWATLTVGNPQIGMLQGIELNSGIGTIFFDCAEPADPDFSGVMIWVDTDPDFSPTDANLAYTGFGTYAVINALPGAKPIAADTPYFLRAAGFDSIGKDNLNISGSIALTVYGRAPSKDEIIADMIKDGALTATKFADGIEPVGVFETLPVLNDPAHPYTGPSTANVGGKLYVIVDGAWTTSVAEVGPGSVTVDAFDQDLKDMVAKVTGGEATPGTIANQIAEKVRQQADLSAEDIEYLGSMVDIAVAAAQFALKATTTATQAQTTRTSTIAATLGDDITAAVFGEATARTNALGAMAETINGLNVTWTQDINAAITNYNQTVATPTFASAISFNTLSTTVGQHTTSITNATQSINGLNARVEWKINNNGVISGIALDSTTDRNGAPTSSATFAVDAFKIQGTGNNVLAPFAVNTTTGLVEISGTTIKDGTLTASKIVANSITSAQIAAGAIKAEQIAAGAITTDMIVVGTAGGIPGTLIKDGAISTAKIATGAITADHMTANSIAASSIQVNTITGDKIKATTITADKIDTRGLDIKAPDGTVILSAQSSLAWGKVAAPSNLAALNGSEAIKNSLISLSGLGYQGSLYATANYGAFADVSTITAANAASFFAANSLDGTYIKNLAADKILAGTLAAGVIYAGAISASQITAGTISGDRINGGTISAVSLSSVTGTFSGNINSSGYVYCTGGSGSPYGMTTLAVIPSASGQSAIAAISSGSGTSAIQASNMNGIGVYASGDRAIVAAGGSWAVYASSGGYGPFTGAHDALLPLGAEVELGDILVDVECIARKGLSDTLFLVARADKPKQKSAVGVCVAAPVALSARIPAVFRRAPREEFRPSLAGFIVVDEHDPEYDVLQGVYALTIMNALGEGQINVCGENGDIEAGDYIVTSSMPGKGMRQDDDLLRSYTVAKAREAVTFDSPGQVKTVACIYVSG
jgi:hypothetical protein